jgi:hypothetical protein
MDKVQKHNSVNIKPTASFLKDSHKAIYYRNSTDPDIWTATDLGTLDGK